MRPLLSGSLSQGGTSGRSGRETGETKASFTKSLVLKQIEQNKLWIGASRRETFQGSKWRTEVV